MIFGSVKVTFQRFFEGGCSVEPVVSQDSGCTLCGSHSVEKA